MPDRAPCPDPETVIALAEHPPRNGAAAETIFRHILECPDCREALAFVCEGVSRAETLRLAALKWRIFIAKFAKLAFPAGNGEVLDAIAAASAATLALESFAAPDDAAYWRAELAFPEPDETEKPIELAVFNADGTPVKDGVFTLFGVEIPLAAGRGTLSREALAKYHSQGGAAFSAPGNPPSAGSPVLIV